MTFCTQSYRKNVSLILQLVSVLSGHKLTCPGVFVLVSPIATQDWPQLQVFSPTSVCVRSIGALSERLLSSTVPPAGFFTGFLCDPPLAVVGLFTWSMGIPHTQVLRLALRCQFVCSEPTPDLLGTRIIARGFPQLFSDVSPAVSVTQFQNDYFEMSSHHVPTLPTAWRKVRKYLALCHGKTWKRQKWQIKAVLSKWDYLQSETIYESVARMDRGKYPREPHKPE